MHAEADPDARPNTWTIRAPTALRGRSARLFRQAIADGQDRKGPFAGSSNLSRFAADGDDGGGLGEALGVADCGVLPWSASGRDPGAERCGDRRPLLVAGRSSGFSSFPLPFSPTVSGLYAH